MQPGTCQRVSAPPAQQTTTKFEQVTQSQLAVAVLVEQAAQQVATGRALALGAGTLLTEHLPQAAGVHAARAHALGQKGHDDGRQHLHQLAGVCPQAAGLAQPGFGTLASTAKNMPQDGSAGTTAHRSTGRCASTEHGAKQAAQIENLISKKVDVLVIVPKDQATLFNVVKEAKKAGIKVISYDRLIKSADVDAYISFDNERVGFIQGEAIYKTMPKGSYYVLSGDPGDNNAKLFKAGAMRALEPAIKKGDIKILGDQSVKDWLPANAMAIAENVLTKHQNKIDAFIAPNDTTAGGVIQALAAQKLAGKVPVSGQDAELAGCKRVLAGTQTMTVYKPLRLIASEAAKLAIALVKGEKIDFNAEKAEGGVKQILLTPILVTKENLDILVQDGFYTKAQLGLQ